MKDIKCTKYTKTISIVLIVASLLLAGCIANEKSGNTTNSNITNGTSNNTISEKYSSNITNVTVDITGRKSSTNTVSSQFLTSSSWCKAGSKITVNGKVYTVKGIELRNNIEMCKAVIEYENGSTVRYFSEDGKNVDEESVSSSGNSRAVSSASSSVK